ncbi:hypothetical protein B0H63DRAFT_535699 [Podospora didyma]|uniref:OTU domain-containing protein n=1 Tax=Podospora didyma TaxID=330526 RepID=A0AAE0K0B0_9PEZI|nr:hypothetical protein B0H63DRAFT_535699 [Podospora didyma]
MRKKLGYPYPVPFEDHYRAEISSFRGRDPAQLLFKGFPTVESVTFAKHPNVWVTQNDKGHHVWTRIRNGECLWTSLALSLFGNAEFWLRVKADHLAFLEAILKNLDHPRYEYYTRLNRSKGETLATGIGRATKLKPRNIWDRLHIPGGWNSDEILALTADVYKLENHFQPMIPNDYLAYEFKFPRMTLQLSQKYRLVSHEPTKPENREDGPRHFFRASMRQVSATEPSLARPPTEYQHLRRAMGFLPFPQDFINGPPSQPRQPPNTKQRVQLWKFR